MRLPRTDREPLIQALFQTVGCPYTDGALFSPSAWEDFLSLIQPEHHPTLAALCS